MKAGKWYVLIIVAAVLFSSCGTQNKFASSFGKRHYTKGFYVDAPGIIQKPERNKIILPVQKTPAIISAKVISNQAAQQEEIRSVQIVKSTLTLSSHKKLIETKPANSIISQQVKVIQSPIITPAVDKEGKSINNIHAIISFLSAVGIIAIASLLAILFVTNIALVAAIWLVAAILAIALDALAVFFAIQAYTKKEADTGGSLIILILNGVILLVALLGYVRNIKK
jgi:hypothetical protein